MQHNFTLSNDVALVLFDFLSRFNEIDRHDLFQDQAEQNATLDY